MEDMSWIKVVAVHYDIERCRFQLISKIVSFISMKVWFLFMVLNQTSSGRAAGRIRRGHVTIDSRWRSVPACLTLTVDEGVLVLGRRCAA
jgi:hypothetical protein